LYREEDQQRSGHILPFSLLHYVREARLLAAGIEVATDGWRLEGQVKTVQSVEVRKQARVEQQVLAG